MIKQAKPGHISLIHLTTLDEELGKPMGFDKVDTTADDMAMKDKNKKWQNIISFHGTKDLDWSKDHLNEDTKYGHTEIG